MTRRCLCITRWVPLAALAVLMGLTSEVRADDARPARLRVYVGTYTGKDGKGIYRCDLDLATGALSKPVLAGEATNPSFLALHPNRRFLYAVGEVAEFEGKMTGAVTAFAIDPKTGDLARLNRQSSGGAGPCHIVTDRAGKNILVANYGGGSAAVLPIAADGQLGAPSSVAQHKGGSVNPQRQKEPHAHSVNLDAGDRFAFVADLGLDRVMVYRFDPARGRIEPNEPPAAAVAAGAGPRHFTFHPTGKYAYVINELANTVTAFAYDGAAGKLTTLQTISTLPADFKGTSYTAEVVAHPSGKFLYGSNRGHNSIAIFRIDPATGKLTAAGHQGHHVKTPRNFNVDPTGAYLIVANQDGNSLVVFRIDPERGGLEPTGQEVAVPMPVCVKFVPIER